MSRQGCSPCGVPTLDWYRYAYVCRSGAASSLRVQGQLLEQAATAMFSWGQLSSQQCSRVVCGVDGFMTD